MSENLTYESSGVNIEEANKAVKKIGMQVKETYNENVLGDLGQFGGLFRLPQGYKKPVLVSGTDGVGTKLKVAFKADEHQTIGIDLVAMCVNDIICQGAVPLFFLDYMATGRVSADKVSDIVSGIVEGCKQSHIPLLGGETAEMPGFYMDDEYDVAGFAVGIAEEDKIITGSTIAEGDILVGLPSSGIHSNGYSLVRKILFDKMGLTVDSIVNPLKCPLKEELLKPTKIYVEEFEIANKLVDLKGIVHITGGGFYENIPRILPEGLGVEVDTTTWKRPVIFDILQENGNVTFEEMYKTFNMGIGMVFVISPEELNELREKVECYEIGKVIKATEERVKLCR